MAHVVVMRWMVAAGVSSCRAALFSWVRSVLAWSRVCRWRSSPVGVPAGVRVGGLPVPVLVGNPGWLFCSSVMAVCSWSVIWVRSVMVVWMLMMVRWLVIRCLSEWVEWFDGLGWCNCAALVGAVGC